MKKWLKKKFFEWSKEAWEAAREEKQVGIPITGGGIGVDTPPNTSDMRFAIRKAINGKFIEVSTYVPQTRGSDWITEYYIVPEGKKVSEAMAMLMLLKGRDE